MNIKREDIYGEIKRAILDDMDWEHAHGRFVDSTPLSNLQLATLITGTFRTADCANALGEGHTWELDGEEPFLPYQNAKDTPPNLLAGVLAGLPTGTGIRHEHRYASYVAIYCKTGADKWEIEDGLDDLCELNLPYIRHGSIERVAKALGTPATRMFIRACTRALLEVRLEQMERLTNRYNNKQ